jgi:hypothetical protein
VLPYGPELKDLIKSASANAGKTAKFASTSGSTSTPKRILYTERRLRVVKHAFVDFFARCCWAMQLSRTSLYVFSPLNSRNSDDHSLTSMLVEERGLPPYLSCLQAPYRVHQHPAMQSMIVEYGFTAVRLWVIAISNPGVLYSTNPSTLSTFLDELATDWQRSSSLIRDWRAKPELFPQPIRKLANRLQSRESAARLAHIAGSDVALPLHVCAPAIATYVCWVGGYVKPFLERLAQHLPPERYRLVPMYSMSTETIETVGHFEGNNVNFLPLATSVLYEFVEEGMADRPENLRLASELEPGKNYAMVVSDPYGLRRYQTGDLFFCKEIVSGLPDLHFARRRDLEYSFTGEKLTAEHVAAAFGFLRAEYPDLKEGKFLTCIPSQPAGEPVPHYKIVVVDGIGKTPTLTDGLAKRYDELLGELNHEYKGKHESGRLGPAQCVVLSPREFINRTAGLENDASEAQFKFLPLYQTTWESRALHPSGLPASKARNVKARGKALGRSFMMDASAESAR